MKKVILISVVMMVSLTAFSQSSPDELIKKFFDEYPKNSNKALDDLYATNVWTLRIKDAIDNLKKEVSGYNIDMVGKYYGYEPIIKKQLSESFVLYSFLVKYDRQPMRFTFEFYKPNDKWTLFSFKIDTNLDDEIEQAAKLYNLDFDKNK
jgi:argonaute-like protein implicated in RNA metabolism and viral defense